MIRITIKILNIGTYLTSDFYETKDRKFTGINEAIFFHI